jgi:GNAT superfamily N-acetyltransferase
MPEIDVVRTYLEMRAPEALRPARVDDPGVAVVRLDPCAPEHYRWLYRVVGERWHWRDRLAWSDERLANYLADPRVEVWELRVGGEAAGYFELLRHDAGDVEIVYFGLVDRFHGRGLGKHLLTEAVTRAWAPGATRVWLHTCTLDGPAALPNYRARGFVETRSETYRERVPGGDGAG